MKKEKLCLSAQLALKNAEKSPVPQIWKDAVARQLQEVNLMATRKTFYPLFKNGLLKKICIKFKIGKYKINPIEFETSFNTITFKKLDN